MGWMELMLVGVIALIVVGPKDLPVMFQALGKMTAKVRRMARDFQSAMNDAADATGAKDVAKDLKGMTSSKNLGLDKLREAADSFDKWEPGKEPKVMGSETAKLAAERAEAARKIREATAEREAAKRAAEAAEASGTGAKTQPTAKPKATKATTTKPKTAKPKATKPASKTTKPAATKAAKAAKPKTTKPKAAKPKPADTAENTGESSA